MKLIDRLRERGFSVTLEGDALLIAPDGKISESLAAWIGEKRAQLILELRLEVDGEWEANCRYCEGKIAFPPDEFMGADYLEWLESQDRP